MRRFSSPRQAQGSRPPTPSCTTCSTCSASGLGGSIDFIGARLQTLERSRCGVRLGGKLHLADTVNIVNALRGLPPPPAAHGSVQITACSGVLHPSRN